MPDNDEGMQAVGKFQFIEGSWDDPNHDVLGDVTTYKKMFEESAFKPDPADVYAWTEAGTLSPGINAVETTKTKMVPAVEAFKKALSEWKHPLPEAHAAEGGVTHEGALEECAINCCVAKRHAPKKASVFFGGSGTVTVSGVFSSGVTVTSYGGGGGGGGYATGGYINPA